MQPETLWHDWHGKHAASQLYPYQHEERASRGTMVQEKVLSLLTGFLGAQCPRGAWKQLINGAGVEDSGQVSSPGQASARLFQTIQGSEPRIRGAALSVSQIPRPLI